MAFPVYAIQKHVRACACFNFAAVEPCMNIYDGNQYESRSTLAPELISLVATSSIEHKQHNKQANHHQQQQPFFYYEKLLKLIHYSTTTSY